MSVFRQRLASALRLDDRDRRHTEVTLIHAFRAAHATDEAQLGEYMENLLKGE